MALRPLRCLKIREWCQLLPFWVQVFSGSGYASENVYYIHTLRDVAEVALSQKSRAQANPDFYEIGRSLDEAAALWLSLSAQAVSACRDLNVIYLSYAALIAEPASVLDKIAEFLGLSPDPKAVVEFCEKFCGSQSASQCGQRQRYCGTCR